jgi:tryptophanyl-tRNA synthetase
MSKQIIVSGIQPTGNLHLGNYLGAVKNWVDLQNSGKYEMYIFIADLHALTSKMKPEELHEQVKITCVELLAAGIDPEKTTFFIQSCIPEHTELAWIFNCVTPIGELKRMTQFKDKTGINKKIKIWNKEYHENLERYTHDFISTYENKPISIDNHKELSKKLFPLIDIGPVYYKKIIELEGVSNTGLLTYPILQAADILLYHGNLVPIGQDQIQHVELTRDTARWFNKKYGEYFPETKHLLTHLPKIMSLLEPTKKMSKSLGKEHVIELADESEMIEAKLKKAVTATAGGEQAPGVANLLALLKEFGDEKIYHDFVQAEKNKSIRYGDLKKELSVAIADHFSSFRAERKKLLKNEKALDKIMADGAKKAQKVAVKTMTEIRKIVGLR